MTLDDPFNLPFTENLTNDSKYYLAVLYHWVTGLYFEL